MNLPFPEPDPELLPRRQDVEWTLGPALQLTVLAVVLALCGICFGLGYTVGSHAHAAATASDPQPGPAATEGTHAKPAATAQTPPPAPPQRALVPVNDGAAPTTAQSTAAAPTGGTSWQVKPALAANQNPPAAAPAYAQPPSPTALMVQVAAISHQEDADVLLAALRKRGYPVSARRDPADDLIHVRLGPFTTRAEAESMKQRLLGDGYNAQVQ